MGAAREPIMTEYVIKPIYFDACDWATCQVMDGKRQIGKFRSSTEAEAYLARLEATPRCVPTALGGRPNPEFVALAAELASALRLRGGKWKRKAIEEEDVRQTEANMEIPF